MGAIATRKAFGDAIVRVGADERVVVLTGDLKNSTHVEDFEKAYPDRFIECGIAERNMIGVAAGLALSGKMPWACSFAAFVANRLEVLRASVAYNQANVRIVGTHAGIGIGDDGASQMGLEDIAAVRALPGFTIVQPCDAIEAERAVEVLLEHRGPAFLRLMRQGTAAVHEPGYAFRLGEAEVLREGSDVALVATGGLVQECLAAAETLAGNGVAASVLNVHTIAPLDAERVCAAAAGARLVVTAEDHNVNGGLGGAVAEALAEAGTGVPLVRVGLRSFGESGSAAGLYDRYGLAGARIAATVRERLEHPDR